MIVLLNFGEFIILDNDLIMVNPLEIIETDNQINRIEDKEEHVKNKYKNTTHIIQNYIKLLIMVLE